LRHPLAAPTRCNSGFLNLPEPQPFAHLSASQLIFLGKIVPNGIPDPCPDFEEAILPVRRKRMEEGYPGVLQFLFLGHCMESKGLLTSVRIFAEYCQ